MQEMKQHGSKREEYDLFNALLNDLKLKMEAVSNSSVCKNKG
jgi:hypothetical protein